MKPRRYGTNPLSETKRESEERVDKAKRYQQIIEILSETNEPLSAKEIAAKMFAKKYTPTAERNFSAPRITEMLKNGIVECVGTKICQYTGRPVGVFKLREKAQNGA